jgi:hypothetical protein
VTLRLDRALLSGFAVPTLTATATSTGQQGGDSAAVFRLESLHQGQGIAFEPCTAPGLRFARCGQQSFDTGPVEGFGLCGLHGLQPGRSRRLEVRSRRQPGLAQAPADLSPHFRIE